MDYLEHIGRSKEDGAPIGSGRYPKGSGDNPYQHQKDIYDRIRYLEKAGVSNTEIAKAMFGENATTTDLRAKRQIARNEVLKTHIAKALKMVDEGKSNTAIAKEFGVTEGTIRNWRKLGEAPETKLDSITKRLKREVDKKKYLDVGEGVERELGTSKDSLRTAVRILEEQGYKSHELKVQQPTNPSQRTTVTVLAKDTVPYKEIRENRDKIMSVEARELRDDISNLNMKTPVSVDSKRIKIKYAEDGGIDRDGVIEIRPGVKDIALPNGNHYAQCRIAVDGTHYLKGMAIYSDEVPKGYDIVFNSNKPKGTDPGKVFKEMKEDADNPFGATVRQYGQDNKGEWHLLSDTSAGKLTQSPINIVNEDKDWDNWSKTLSSQFLSKQYPVVAKEQLKLTYERRKNEFDEINSLTNPTVKRKLLADFADSCDSDAVNLKAAAFPRQATHVILPLTKIKDNEIYAPNYENGEKVILVRYPHEGVFQIPMLTVNNNNLQGKKLLGQAKKAVGISGKAAEQLSGADFDGDTVTVIPLRGQKLKYSPPLKGLEGYDPKVEYKRLPGDTNKTAKTDNFHKQTEMGRVSNLITDMTIKGASPEDLTRAVRHSMCVIDAEKHNLDWKRSERENNIKDLKERYQGGANRGASTIISKASAEYRIEGVRTEGVTVGNPKTGKKSRMYIDPNTGEKLYTTKEETYPAIDKKTGKEVIKKRTTTSTKMYEAKDAYELVSPDKYPIERIYADHANRLKALANEARKAQLATGDIKYSKEAAKKYAPEVASLDAALRVFELKKPQERRATLIADTKIKAMIADNPELKEDKDQLKKKRAQAIGGARARLGLTRFDIRPTDREWEAIQAGAISKTKLEKILNRADGARIRELATPKAQRALTAAKQSQIKSMIARGYSQAEVAEHLGVSVSTVQKYM